MKYGMISDMQLVDDELNIRYQITTRLTNVFISNKQSIVFRNQLKRLVITS
jgi:hypothetical protein